MRRRRFASKQTNQVIHGFCVSFTSVTNTARGKSDIEQMIIIVDTSRTFHIKNDCNFFWHNFLYEKYLIFSLYLIFKISIEEPEKRHSLLKIIIIKFNFKRFHRVHLISHKDKFHKYPNKTFTTSLRRIITLISQKEFP
jgi:hypothetical protein